MCGLSDRVEALAFKVWRDCTIDMIQTTNFPYNHLGDKSFVLRRTEQKLPILKTNFAFSHNHIRACMWKVKMNENIPPDELSHCQKKVKTDKSNVRRHCRVTCGIVLSCTAISNLSEESESRS